MSTCNRGHALTPDNTYDWGGKRRCRKCRLNWERNSPKSRARYYRRNRTERRRLYLREYRQSDTYREYNRIYQEARRRAAQIPQRPLIRASLKGKDESLGLPAGPFREWLRERENVFDGLRKDFARYHGLDDSHLSSLLNGKQETVHIDVVDRALTEAGQPYMLNVLYPVEAAA